MDASNADVCTIDKAMTDLDLKTVSEMLNTTKFTEYQLRHIASKSLINIDTVKFFFEIVNRIDCLLDGQLEVSIQYRRVNVTKYILKSGRVSPDNCVSLTTFCYMHGTTYQLQLLQKYNMLGVIQAEDILDLKHNQYTFDKLTLLAKAQKLIVSERCVIRAARLRDIEMLQHFDSLGLVTMKAEWYPDVLATGHDEVIKLMFSHLDKSVRIQPYAFHLCVGSVVVTQLLLDRGVDPSSPDLLKYVVQEGSADVLALILSHNTKANVLDDLLVEACTANNSESVKVLLNDGRADPTYDNSKCLIASASSGHTEVVRLLLEDYRADPTTRMSLPIREAFVGGHMDTVNQLLWDGRSKLTMASLAGIRQCDDVRLQKPMILS